MPEISAHTGRLAGFFGLKRDYFLLLVMVVLIGMGEKTGSRFVPKYIEVLGAGVLLIGLYGGLEDLLGALWSLPGGYISDRLGTKKALAVFNLIAMTGYLIVVMIPSWPAVMVASIFFLSWSALSLPTTMSLVGTLLPKSKRAMGVSMHSIIRRIPMGGGPIIGGALIGVYGMVTGVRITFAIAFILAAAAMILQQKMAPSEATKYEPLHLTALVRRFNPGLKRLLVSDILIRFCERIPYSFVILWVMDIVRKEAFEFGWLTAIEMGTAMLLYIPVAYFSDRAERKPFVLITFGFFTLFPAVLYFSRTTSLLIFAFIIRGLKEFGEPTRKALIVDLAVPDAKARTVGAYYFLRDTIVALASFAGGILWKISPAVNLWTAFAFGAIGTLYFAIYGKSAERTE
ncbi:MAG: MFS transporter [candidate division Zixibacteria bacterium]|nr:MFS transporter [candidate division Zixibacteria bacterium]